ncbi:hypothetical protein [Embleya sp. NPDC005575]|uniref:hypothetical protein n=1 Tax=Embleya sp. NPDC005575 TaxID=3156892 RepID=UPI00339FAFD6
MSPNQAWAALIAMCGYVPLPLTGRDYLELLPVRWHRITERGIRIDHRTYDHEVSDPVRGSPPESVAGRAGGRSTTTPTTAAGSGSGCRTGN